MLSTWIRVGSPLIFLHYHHIISLIKLLLHCSLSLMTIKFTRIKWLNLIIPIIKKVVFNLLKDNLYFNKQRKCWKIIYIFLKFSLCLYICTMSLKKLHSKIFICAVHLKLCVMAFVFGYWLNELCSNSALSCWHFI